MTSDVPRKEAEMINAGLDVAPQTLNIKCMK